MKPVFTPWLHVRHQMCVVLNGVLQWPEFSFVFRGCPGQSLSQHVRFISSLMIHYHVFVLQRLHWIWNLLLSWKCFLSLDCIVCLASVNVFKTQSPAIVNVKYHPFLFWQASWCPLWNSRASLQKGVCEMCYGLLSREYIFVQSNFNKST